MQKVINRQLGDKGEDLAERFLEDKSYRIIARNFHSGSGEIDIIALDGNVLVFVEVKTRINSIETALESMTPAKCSRILRTAEYFLAKNNRYEDHFTRFDLIAVLMGPDGPAVRHIEEAITF